MKIEGDFTREENGSWFFEGTAKSYTDLYDFNESNRSTLLEILTTAGRVFSGTDYELDITGEYKIRLTGTGFPPDLH
ncbi:Colicin-M [compost metagenome]